MSAEVIAEELKAAELALREAVAKHGTTHPIVLERLVSFIELARKAGNEGLAAKLEEKAKIIRQTLQLPATGGAAAPATPAPTTDAKSVDEQSFVERHLFNSRGEHVAVVFDGHLYSPVGRYLGRWDEELDAFISDKGSYLGQTVEENRLACDPNWHYRHMNFGTKSNGGSRTGWSRQPDTDRILLPSGYTDVSFAETGDE